MLKNNNTHSTLTSEKRSIRRLFYLGSISTLILLSVVFFNLYSSSISREHENTLDHLSTALMDEKKRFLRNAVERTISLIEQERKLVRAQYAEKGLDENQIEAIAVKTIGDLIRNIQLIDDGYIWVNRIVKYDGGDKYAIREIHPNLPHTEGQWLSTNTTDIKGNRPYEVELNGVNKDGELFFEYYFKKMNSEKIAHKMSFAKLYKPYDWVVATGVYLDDVDQLIHLEKNRMQGDHDALKYFAIAIFVVVIIAGVLIIIVFERRMSHLVQDYEAKINEYTVELEIAKGVAERANTAKSEFLASMSHDLRTPLNAIMGFSDMMRSKTFGPLGNEHYEQYADDIYDSGTLLVSLINDVLDLSKIEAGKYELHEQVLDIPSLVQTSFGQLQNMANNKNQSLSLDVPLDMPSILGDERVLIQIFNNLLSNAIKFTPNAGKINVSASVDESNGIVIRVRDNGIGLSQEGIAKALRPFEQADVTQSRRHEGTGLGLHICTHMMELFGGTLYIESEVDKGATVILCFPPSRTISST